MTTRPGNCVALLARVAVAAAIAVTLAGRVEFAVFATTYFLSEIPLMLGAIAVFRRSQVARA